MNFELALDLLEGNVGGKRLITFSLSAVIRGEAKGIGCVASTHMSVVFSLENYVVIFVYRSSSPAASGVYGAEKQNQF